MINRYLRIIIILTPLLLSILLFNVSNDVNELVLITGVIGSVFHLILFGDFGDNRT